MNIETLWEFGAKFGKIKTLSLLLVYIYGSKRRNEMWMG